MIEYKPIRKECGEIPRLGREILEGYSKHESAKVLDSMESHGLMYSSIKPVVRGSKLCGQAITVRGADARAIARAADNIQRGDILVISSCGIHDIAVGCAWLYSYLEKKQAGGCIVDGAVCDADAIHAGRLPVFARAVCARRYFPENEGEVNITISCGGMLVAPGDILLGDDDGVVTVPAFDALRTLRLSDEHLALELAKVKRNENGEKLYETSGCIPRADAWK